MFAKFFLEGSFLLVYNINPESFPPLFVPFSLSACSLVARSVSIAAPQVAEVKPKQTPMIIFMVVSALSIVVILFLRKNKPVKFSIIEQSDEKEEIK